MKDDKFNKRFSEICETMINSDGDCITTGILCQECAFDRQYGGECGHMRGNIFTRKKVLSSAKKWLEEYRLKILRKWLKKYQGNPPKIID